jgi:hypothetical protein
MLDFENSRNPYDEKRKSISPWKGIADFYCASSYDILSTGSEIMEKKIKAKDALIATLGEIDAERFISMVKRDTFDYTEWQRDLWRDKDIEEIHALATEYEKS